MKRPLLITSIIFLLVTLSITIVLNKIDNQKAPILTPQTPETEVEDKPYVFTELMEGAINNIREFDESFPKIKINQTSDAGHISLFIVDFGLRKQPKNFNVAQGNVAVINPKTIVMDARFAAQLILLSNAEHSFFIQEILSKGKKREIESKVALNHWNIMRMAHVEINNKTLEHANTINTHYDELSKVGSFLDISGKSLLGSINEMNDYMSGEVQQFGSMNTFMSTVEFAAIRQGKQDSLTKENALDAVTMPLALYLYPIILHELNHIQNGETLNFFSVQDLSTQSKNILSEAEKRADAYVLRKIDSLSEEEVSIATLAVPMKRYLSSFAEIFFEKEVINVFGDFRMMNTQMLARQINYQRDFCDAGENGFFDINQITSIEKSPFPLITEKELSKINTRIQRSRDGIHPHLNERYRTYSGFGSVDKEAIYLESKNLDSIVMNYLVSSITEINRVKLKSFYQQEYGGQLKEKDFGVLAPWGIFDEDFKRTNHELQKVAVCPLEKCEIYFHSFDHWISLAGDESGVSVVQAYIPAFTKFKYKITDDHPEFYEIISEERKAFHSMLLAALLTLTSGHNSSNIDSEFVASFAEEYGSFIEKLDMCNFGSAAYENDKVKVHIGSVDNNRSIVIEIIMKA